jgi:glycosyltransferase involved in cell wall biosynthesis
MVEMPKRWIKVVIQIHCYNEEQTLGVTLQELPRELPGVDVVEWLIVDDGSTDRTVEVARAGGVDHIVRLPRHGGLACAFRAGLEASLRRGADIIVFTDADNQYCAADISALIAPILGGRAEFVIGARPILATEHFSPLKKFLQRLGSWVVRAASQTTVPDAASGFRAMRREVAMRLHVFNEYTHTLETIIQAGQQGMAIVAVPIRTNPDLRPSRLVKSIASYVGRQALTIVRIFITYRPFPSFAVPGAVVFGAGLLLSGRFLFFYVAGGGSGHVQSLILAALLLGAGFFLSVVGVLADLIAVNRKLLEKLDWRLQQVAEELRPGEGALVLGGNFPWNDGTDGPATAKGAGPHASQPLHVGSGLSEGIPGRESSRAGCLQP